MMNNSKQKSLKDAEMMKDMVEQTRNLLKRHLHTWKRPDGKPSVCAIKQHDDSSLLVIFETEEIREMLSKTKVQ